ncbi:MAG: transporter substrate-binding domain-containing protein [Bacteriovoracaceae bacterium]|nr:transporter substrate-binding domain-containing protein [Bacteriovoracaceae bacterium]
MKNILIVILLSFFTNQIKADEINLGADLWCPYTCEPGSSMPGFMIEIAQEVFKKHGHTIKYQNLSWARALADARIGRIDGAVGALRKEVVGFMIPQIANGNLLNYFYTLSTDPWFYKDEKSLYNKTFAVINGYSYGAVVDKLIENKHPSLKSMAGDDVLTRMIQMTSTKRIDGFIEDPAVLSFSLKKRKLKSSDFKIASPNMATDPDLFIAFSPKNPKSKEYARLLDEGMNEFRKSGKLKEILNKYSVKDWK